MNIFSEEYSNFAYYVDEASSTPTPKNEISQRSKYANL